MADWFVVNVADAPAFRHEVAGVRVRFEDAEDPFPDFGINIRVLEPGEPACRYHSENRQEGFLVLSGECLLIVEDEERALKAWDYFHCPAGVTHVFVGAGDGPCAILMVGARGGDTAHYPVSEVAARYGASVSTPTDSPPEAYSDWSREFTPVKLDWPPR